MYDINYLIGIGYIVLYVVVCFWFFFFRVVIEGIGNINY